MKEDVETSKFLGKKLKLLLRDALVDLGGEVANIIDWEIGCLFLELELRYLSTIPPEVFIVKFMIAWANDLLFDETYYYYYYC
jgi:hypothetical protein